MNEGEIGDTIDHRFNVKFGNPFVFYASYDKESRKGISIKMISSDSIMVGASERNINGFIQRRYWLIPTPNNVIELSAFGDITANEIVLSASALSEGDSYTIYNLEGRLVAKGNYKANSIYLESGVYIISNTTKKSIYKFVVNPLNGLNYPL